MYKMSQKSSYLPNMTLPAPPPEVKPLEMSKGEAYTLKKILDTDKVFKKRMKASAIDPDVPLLSPEPDVEPKVPVQSITESEIESDKNLTSDDFTPETQRPPKTKRKMTDKQLEALARGRATSLAKRQAKAQTKKVRVLSPPPESDAPEPEPMSSDEEPETKSSGPLKVNMVKWEEEPQVDRNPSKKRDPDTGKVYRMARSNPVSKEEIETMMTGAIRKYDGERKVAKAEKKEKARQTVHNQHISQQLNRVLNPSDPEYFNECFTFS